MQTSGFPRGSDSSLLTGAPLILPGINQDGSAIVPWRAANLSSGTTGSGVPGVAMMGFDTTNYQRMIAAAVTANNVSIAGLNGIQWMKAHNSLFNGTNWDLQYNNDSVEVFASAARTLTTTSAMQTNYNAKGAVFCLGVTATGGTGTTLNIQVFDVMAGGGGSLAFASFTTTANPSGVFTFKIYPAIAAEANPTTNGSLSGAMPRFWVVSIVPSNATSYTYSLERQMIL